MSMHIQKMSQIKTIIEIGEMTANAANSSFVQLIVYFDKFKNVIVPNGRETARRIVTMTSQMIDRARRAGRRGLSGSAGDFVTDENFSLIKGGMISGVG